MSVFNDKIKLFGFEDILETLIHPAPTITTDFKKDEKELEKFINKYLLSGSNYDGIREYPNNIFRAIDMLLTHYDLYECHINDNENTLDRFNKFLIQIRDLTKNSSALAIGLELIFSFIQNNPELLNVENIQANEKSNVLHIINKCPIRVLGRDENTFGGGSNVIVTINEESEDHLYKIISLINNYPSLYNKDDLGKTPFNYLIEFLLLNKDGTEHLNAAKIFGGYFLQDNRYTNLREDLETIFIKYNELEMQKNDKGLIDAYIEHFTNGFSDIGIVDSFGVLLPIVYILSKNKVYSKVKLENLEEINKLSYVIAKQLDMAGSSIRDFKGANTALIDFRDYFIELEKRTLENNISKNNKAQDYKDVAQIAHSSRKNKI